MTTDTTSPSTGTAPAATLEMTRGAGHGTKIPLRAAGTVLGREQGCSFVVDDQLVSRRHARVSAAGGVWSIEDLGSEHGTEVNGVRLATRRVLEPGDQVRMGHTVLVFRATAAAAATPAPAAPAAPPTADAEGDPLPEIPGFVISERIGEGPSGPVFRGVHTARGRDVAVKVLEPSLAALPGCVEAFRSEAAAAEALTHPHVVPVYESGEAGGLHYYAMELSNGGTLAQKAGAFPGGALPWRDAVRIAGLAAAGLAQLHARRLVHRDLKPASVLLGRNGQVRLGAPVSALAVDGVPDGRGDSPFLSPEQILGRPVTAASDIYSLGAVLHFALSGRPPYAGRTRRDIATAMGAGDPAPVAAPRGSIPPEVVEIVSSMTSRDPAGRPQDAAEISRRLGEIALRADGPQDRSHQKKGVQGWMWKALPVVVAAAGIVWFVASGQAAALWSHLVGSKETAADTGPQKSPAQLRYEANLEKEGKLTPLSIQNADRWQRVCDEYASLARENPIDDPFVALAWGRRRSLVRSLLAVRETDDAVVLRVERFIGEVIEQSKLAPQDGRNRDVTTVMSERESQYVLAERSIAEGRPAEGLGKLAAWIVAERAALATRNASDLEKEYVHGAIQWLRDAVTGVASKMQADLDVDREILRAHLCETTAFGGPRTKSQEPDFLRASARLDALVAATATMPGRARIAARRAALAEQAGAWTSVRGISPAVPDAKKEESWQAAVVRTIAATFAKLPADAQEGALLLAAESGEAAAATSLAAKAPAAVAAKDRRIHREVLALEEHADLRSSKDAARRGAALLEWIEKHAATDASLVLPTSAAGGALDAHPAVNGDKVELWFARWGEAPAPGATNAAAADQETGGTNGPEGARAPGASPTAPK